jgi:hypothetical protein
MVQFPDEASELSRLTDLVQERMSRGEKDEDAIYSVVARERGRYLEDVAIQVRSVLKARNRKKGRTKKSPVPETRTELQTQPPPPFPRREIPRHYLDVLEERRDERGF